MLCESSWWSIGCQSVLTSFFSLCSVKRICANNCSMRTCRITSIKSVFCHSLLSVLLDPLTTWWRFSDCNIYLCRRFFPKAFCLKLFLRVFQKALYPSVVACYCIGRSLLLLKWSYKIFCHRSSAKFIGLWFCVSFEPRCLNAYKTQISPIVINIQIHSEMMMERVVCGGYNGIEPLPVYLKQSLI